MATQIRREGSWRSGEVFPGWANREDTGITRWLKTFLKAKAVLEPERWALF